MSNNRVEVAKKMREIHKQNIQISLEHRLQVARNKGDMSLIRQLEAEMKHFQ